jgi:hypothetical protein
MISDSIYEIIGIIIKHDFKPLKVEIIANELNVNITAIHQRIRRDEEFFDVVNARPKTIELKKTDNVLFILYGNTCASCLSRKDEKDLKVHYINPKLPEPRTWKNMLPICLNCDATNRPVIKNDVSNPIYALSPRTDDTWEHKIVRIKSTPYIESENLMFEALLEKHGSKKAQTIYVFQEGEEREKWSRLVDVDGSIFSFKVDDILNHYGATGWELVGFRNDEKHENEQEFVFKRKIVEK